MSGSVRFRVDDTIVLAEPGAAGTYEATLYPALPGIDVEALPEGDPDIRSRIQHLRVDTVNACNLDCVFCHSDFSVRAKHLSPEQFARAVSFEHFENLRKITLGCAYEPLMGRHFEALPAAAPGLHGRITADVVTNGVLLDRRDLGAWAEFGLGHLYVSIYSHIPELYERTGRGAAKFDQISANMKEIRRRFPNLPITVVNPLSKTNDVDLPGFCTWAFDELGVDAIDLRRAFFTDTPAPGYPAYTFTHQATEALGRSPWLTDGEWRGVLESCAPFMNGAQKRTITVGGIIDYDSILLTREASRESVAA